MFPSFSLRMAELRIASYLSSPGFSSASRLCSNRDEQHCYGTGYDIEFFQVSIFLKTKLKMIMRYANLHGRYLPDDSHDGPGVVADLGAGFADIGANPVRIAADRLENATFTIPFAYMLPGFDFVEDGRRTFLLTKVLEALVDDNFLIHLFSPLLYSLILVSTLTYALVYFGLQRRCISIEGFDRCLWLAIAGLLHEPCEKRRPSNSRGSVLVLYFF